MGMVHAWSSSVLIVPVKGGGGQSVPGGGCMYLAGILVHTPPSIPPVWCCCQITTSLSTLQEGLTAVAWVAGCKHAVLGL